jgi:hypothetical protein
MHKQNEDLIERFKEYNKEHQKLLDKYFFDFQSEDFDQDADASDKTPWP